MIDVRRFATLGHADHGWLDARHHFSFADYHHPQRTHWGALRVWNDDSIAPGTGFAPHGHRDMEIITYVRTGAITHRDSMGNVGRTGAGDVQVMSAGRGVQHSENNAEAVTTTLFQIWILPDQTGGEPSWGMRAFPKADRSGAWVVLASGDARDDALPIRADARVSGATLRAGETLSLAIAPGRHAYLVPATGQVRIGAVDLMDRDGAAITNEDALVIEAVEDSELVLVETR